MDEIEEKYELVLERSLDHSSAFNDAEIRGMIYFGNPFFRFLIPVGARNIRIWDSQTGEKVKDLKVHNSLGVFRVVLKWNNDSFLVVESPNENSVPKTLLLFSIGDFSKKELPIPSTSGFPDHYSNYATAVKVVQLDVDLLLLTIGVSAVLKIPECKVLHRLSCLKGNSFWEMKTRKSINFPNCIYTSCNYEIATNIPRIYGSKMINWKENQVYFTFKNHTMNGLNKIYGLDVFVNSRKEEVLVFGGMAKVLRVFRIEGSTEKDKKVKVTHLQDLKMERKIDSLIGLKSGFLSIGNRKGDVILLKYSTNNHFKEVCRVGFFTTFVVQLETFDQENEIKILAYANNNGKQKVLVIRTGIRTIEHLDLKLSKLDEKERIDFLMEEQDSYIFTNELKKKINFNLKTTNLELNVLRILLFH